MKKVFLLLPLLTILAVTAFAQSFTLSNSNGPLTHDTIVDVYAHASVELIEERVYITNNSEEVLQLLVKKDELEVLEGTMNTFCFNGLCFPPHVFQAPYVLTLEPGQTSGEYDFYGDYYPSGQVGSTLIRYTIFDPDNVEDSVSVRIRYNTFIESFTLSDHNGLLTHDTMLVLNGSPNDEYIKANVFITNTTSDIIHLLVKKEDIEQLENTFNTFCWIDQCYPPNVVLSPVPMALAPGATTTEVDFYLDYFPNGQEGITIVRYTLFNQNIPADSVSIIFKFNTSNVGIDGSLQFSEKIISKPYPNPASSLVHFDIEIPSSIRDASIVIRNLLGSEVMRYYVGSSNGRVSLPVSQLKEGFYFYTLNVEDNYPVQTGRLIIKR